MNKLLIITGPTATGKTKLGIELAKKYNGEIISADSQQVYIGNDELSGKDKKLYGGIKYWGIDLVNPGYKYNVSDFVEFAQGAITDIHERGKLPIMVGGSGHYVRALLDPFATINIPPSEELRKKNWRLEELQEKLQKLDLRKWESMNKSDRNNPRRLVRALEVVLASSRKISSFPKKRSLVSSSCDLLLIGLMASRGYLYQKIVKRRSSRPDLIQKELSLAKKQLLYQKKFLKAKWFDVSKSDYRDRVFSLVKTWYTVSNGRPKN